MQLQTKQPPVGGLGTEVRGGRRGSVLGDVGKQLRLHGESKDVSSADHAVACPVAQKPI